MDRKRRKAGFTSITIYVEETYSHAIELSNFMEAS